MASSSNTTTETRKNGVPTSVAVAKQSNTANLDAKQKEAEALIRKFALMGTASGFIPVMGVDVLASTAIQVKMIKDLAEIYDYDIDDQLMRMAITTGVTAVGGRLLNAMAGSLAQSFAPVKMFINGATQAAVSGFLTLEIGNIYKSKMELGENPSDIGVMDIVNHIVAQVQEGKWDPNKLSLSGQLGSMVSNKN